MKHYFNFDLLPMYSNMVLSLSGLSFGFTGLLILANANSDTAKEGANRMQDSQPWTYFLLAIFGLIGFFIFISLMVALSKLLVRYKRKRGKNLFMLFFKDLIVRYIFLNI
jgi:hypothetical protein